jgi:hypothetical protein
MYSRLGNWCIAVEARTHARQQAQIIFSFRLYYELRLSLHYTLCFGLFLFKCCLSDSPKTDFLSFGFGGGLGHVQGRTFWWV